MLAALALVASADCGGAASGPSRTAVLATPGIGDPTRGKALFTAKACIGCHQVRGEIAGGLTGPELLGFASRPTIAGTIPNTPENVWRWLENPARLKPGTLMVRTPLSPQELDDLVAYLQTLQ